MDVVYGILVLIMLKLCILPGGKPFGIIRDYHSVHTAMFLLGINDTLPIDILLKQRC